MKNHILIIALLSLPIVSFGQEKEDLYFLEADSTWFKEVIEFPLIFAGDIPFEGYEDLRFDEGWAKEDSPGFWSYVCAWNVNGSIDPTKTLLEDYMQLYFDGLMDVGPNSGRQEKIKGTTAIFLKEDTSKYKGKIKTFDTRFTQKSMILNVLIETVFCEKTNTTIILFRFSPTEFTDAIWYKLNDVKVKDGFCKL